jgi:hypothetical protein
VATAHVPQHSFCGAYYALKAVAAADPAQAGPNISREWNWELQHAPGSLKEEVLKRLIIKNSGHKITVKIQKGEDF